MSTTPGNHLYASASLAAQENSDAFVQVKDVNGVEIKAKFWDSVNAEDLSYRWDKSYPFQLLILKRVNGKWQKAEGIDKVPTEFTLPIGPQALEIDMPFAMTVEAASKGVVEQANGAPFREIVLSGTTGFLPTRGTAAHSDSGLLHELGGIFAGTAISVKTLAVQATAASSLSEPSNLIPAITTGRLTVDSPYRGTGYFQFLLLKRYLEWYAEAKRTSPDICLGFAVWKEQEVYLVTPTHFKVSRSASNPMLYNYSLGMRAWRRIKMDVAESSTDLPHNFAGTSPAKFLQILGKLQESRRVLENSKKVLLSVRGDVNNILFGTLKQVTLLAKDLLGVGLTAADVSIGIINDLQEPIFEKIGAASNPLELISIPSKTPLTADTQTLLQQLSQYSKSLLKQSTRGGRTSSDTEIGNVAPIYGKILANKNYNSGLLPNGLFNPETAGDYYDFWSRIELSSLNLKRQTLDSIQTQIKTARLLKRKDFELAQIETEQLLNDFEASIGLGSGTINKIYGNQRSKIREAHDGDWDIIFALNELISAYAALAASKTVDSPTGVEKSIDYISGLARGIGMAFVIPTSKYLVPTPYGSTLEQIALRYLGSADRWVEIATLNGLTAPYIDEVGFYTDLLVNGSDNCLTVQNSNNFYVNQLIRLSAIGIPQEQRRIVKIEKFPTFSTIYVDGALDLDRFTLIKEPKIHAFLPDTTNSTQWIYIPGSENVQSDWLTKDIPGIDAFDPYVRRGGVSLLLDSGGDLVITSTGTRLISGLANAIQRVKIGFGTQRGTLLQHPEFGFGFSAGTSSADISAQDILTSAKSFIANERIFSGVDSATIKVLGNAMFATVSVRLASNSSSVPITVQIR